MKAWQARRVAAAMRAAVRVDCRKCGAPVLVGDDDDHVAVRVTVDAEPVDRLAEAVGLAEGRASYDLLPSPGGGDLWHRDRHHQLSSAPPRYPIHLEHRCPTTAAWERLKAARTVAEAEEA